MNAAEVQERLIEASAKHVDLVSLSSLSKENPKLSGLFVPSVTDSYWNSRQRVMIVGKETRGWGKTGLAEVTQFSSAVDYIKSMMARHQGVLAKDLTRSKFFQFYRQAARALTDEPANRDSIIWANLFCLDQDSKSPVRCNELEAIKKLSRNLLQAQLEILRPKVILFVTGYRYDNYIKEFFKVKSIKVHTPKKLWEFEINDVRAYRTAHPQWSEGNEYRKQALEKAANLMREGQQSQEAACSA